VLRSVTPDATAEEVAAVIAAIAAFTRVSGENAPPDVLSEWVRGTRVVARRVGLQRGPWRLSGRIGRRVRP
jgi:hypothetical protein